MLLYSNEDFIVELFSNPNNKITIELHEKNKNSFFYVMNIEQTTFPCLRMKLNHLCEIGKPSIAKSFIKIDTIEDILVIFINENTMNEYMKYCDCDKETQQCIFKM